MASVDVVVGSAASWAAVAVAGYLALGLAAALLARRRATLARWAEGVLLLYPPFARAALRALAATALGVTAVAPSMSASAAEPHRGSAPRPPLVAPARPAAEPLDWPQPHPPTVGDDDNRRPPRAEDSVVVASGDCLWSVAARAIGPDASASQIAAAWPRWWSANRSVIGADPDLLHPGVRLRRPRPTERSAS